MWKALILAAALAVAAQPSAADADSVRRQIVNELHADGYSEVRISRTLLGRMRFVATKENAIREIVVNPATGLVLRDYVQFLFGDDREDGSGFAGSSEDDDREDHSGSGGGDDDDEDDHDNSGSGSENSGSGSGSSGSGSGSDDDPDDD